MLLMYTDNVCSVDYDRVQNDTAIGDAHLIVGEWYLGTEFNTTDDFYKKFGDAQKYAYSQGAGWIVSDVLQERQRDAYFLRTVQSLQTLCMPSVATHI